MAITPPDAATIAFIAAHVSANTTSLLGSLIGADFNSLADQQIPLTTSSPYLITRIGVTNPNVSMTHAQGGFYTGANKSGTTIIPSSQAYTALTTSASFLTPTVSSGILTPETPLYLSLTTPQSVAITPTGHITGFTINQMGAYRIAPALAFSDSTGTGLAVTARLGLQVGASPSVNPRLNWNLNGASSGGYQPGDVLSDASGTSSVSDPFQITLQGDLSYIVTHSGTYAGSDVANYAIPNVGGDHQWPLSGGSGTGAYFDNIRLSGTSTANIGFGIAAFSISNAGTNYTGPISVTITRDGSDTASDGAADITAIITPDGSPTPATPSSADIYVWGDQFTLA